MGFLSRVFGRKEDEDIFGDPGLHRALKLTSEGNYHGDRRDFGRAIDCFRRAISEKPAHVPAHLGLAIAYRELGDFDAALDVLAHAPTQADFGGPMDFGFEIAFTRACTILAKHQRARWQIDNTELIDAIRLAQEVANNEPAPSEMILLAGRALGVDPTLDRDTKLALLNQLLQELRPHHPQ